MQTFLDTTEDLEWLRDVHGIDTKGIVCAILYGNEDSPEKIEAFAVNDYRAIPTVYTADELLGLIKA